ncbi:MAG: DUF488 family protein [Steroidobacteraceae bacterium]
MHELDSSFTLIAPRHLRIKRIYDAPARSDGFRLLVDRLWPRGITKKRAMLSDWMPELAPSAELRKWFGHDPGRWSEFRRRYYAELAGKQSLIKSIRNRLLDERVTLLYAARDATRNQAQVLKQFIEAA